MAAKVARTNIYALLGAAQVSIELADDGDPDQYGVAAQYLTETLSHGKYKESGSKRLSNSDISTIHYMRGYALIKSWEADTFRTWSTKLRNAQQDFQNCKETDPNDSKARAAIEEIDNLIRRRKSESWQDVWGPRVIFFVGAAVFVFAQVGLCVHWVYPDKGLANTDYTALTFGSLLFMVAALYLPQVLKLKVSGSGVELEKASIDRVSAPAILGISRSKLSIPISRPGNLDWRR